MIAAEDLVAGYGRITVLHGATFSVAEGELVGILGHNGMGKSTLIRTLVGLIRATKGTVRLAGADVTRLPTHARARAGLGYVPQGRWIFPALSVAENLRLAAVASGLPPSTVDEVLADFPELPRLLTRPGGALSGGEQQILALARALCGRPKVLLLDEPTEGIQPSIVQAITERLRALRTSRGLTVLLVEQNLDFIRSLADRVLLIQRGRIVRELTPDEVEDEARIAEFTGLA
ncbi:MAG: ABC transporter ATP-binding protein [Geminicoccaceae bacterium]